MRVSRQAKSIDASRSLSGVQMFMTSLSLHAVDDMSFAAKVKDEVEKVNTNTFEKAIGKRRPSLFRARMRF
jgi:hypothetical protein